MAKKINTEINGKQYYRITKTVGKKADGTPIKKQFYGTGIKEANEKADKYMNDIKNGLINNYEHSILSDLMSTWLFEFLHNSSKIKPSTFQRYEGIYRNYIKNSDIAGLKLIECTTIRLQKFFNELYQNKTYSQLKWINDVLRLFFNWCIDNGYMLKNPCLKVDLKGNKTNILTNNRKEVEILTENEIKLIKKKLHKDKYELLFLLDIATGLRQGELLALDWEHIDLKKKQIHIEKSIKQVYVYENESNKHIETIFQVPKTLKSIRYIPLSDTIVNLLQKVPRKSGLLFSDEFGNPLKGKNISARWNRILKSCNIPHKKFHSIRHTFASMLLKNGVDIETVSELMGHSSISITQIYLHSSDNQKQSAINKINYLL